jgi:hypothetical protein
MRKVMCTVLALLLIPASAGAWGEKGHLMINRLAIDAGAASLPEFMTAGRNQLIYNGYEPDRWRDEGNIPMNIAQAPDHFFDSELWGSISTIDPDRYAFMEKVAAKKTPLIKIGYLPYAIMETYGRLRNAMRKWRQATTPEDREAARVNALVYGGILGHYVGDGANPMHLSIHFNGWDATTANPNSYTLDRRLHSRYEAEYVNRAIDIVAVRPKVQAPRRLANVFTSVRDYLTQSFGEVVPVYEMEKKGEFNPEKPQNAGSNLITSQLARAATMLGNLWYTAWLESAEPVPPPAR